MKDYEILGEHAIYPGHPMTIAYCIINKYKSLEEASKLSEHNCPEAVGDGDIPGGGGSVYSALDFLHNINKGVPIEIAIKEANKTWKSYCWGPHADRAEPGQKQANNIKQKFIEAAFSWQLIKESPKEHALKTVLL